MNMVVMVGIVSLMFVSVELSVRFMLVCRWFVCVVVMVVSFFGSSMSVVIMILIVVLGVLSFSIVCLMVGDSSFVSSMIVMRFVNSSIMLVIVVWLFGVVVCIVLFVVLCVVRK